MRFSKDKRYSVHGNEVRLVQIFNFRGIVYRFAYLNGSCFDVTPGEGRNIEEIKEPS